MISFSFQDGGGKENLLLEEWGRSKFLEILSELCGDFFDGFVLGFGDFEPNVADKEDLQNDENDENVGSDSQLKQKAKVKISSAFTFVCLTMRGVNPSPTKKLAVQLVTTATDVAIPRAPWVNSSVTKNQGMDPGPVAKPTTKVMTMTMET